MEIDKRTTLNIMKMIVIILGVKRVKPSDSFIEYAQMTSNTPAKIKIAQAIFYSHFKWLGRPNIKPIKGVVPFGFKV